MSSHARSCAALALTFATLAGCGLGKADMACKAYRALGTGNQPEPKQAQVVRDHINTQVRDPALEVSLAHMAAVYWCNQRDHDGLFVHDDDEVGDYLNDWK